MVNMKRWLATGITVALLLGTTATTALASRVQDLVRLKNDQPNELVGLGLVFGLNGTGDGGDYSPMAQQLQQMLGKFGDPIQLALQLKNTANVALVQISVTVPPNGAHAGDRLDVQVMSLNAKSLKGGTLFVTPLMSSNPNIREIFATASGPLSLEDDASKNKAVVHAGSRGGAVMQADFRPDNSSEGSFTLVLQEQAASYANAVAIAAQINEDVSPQTEGQLVATAEDAKTVVVAIPKSETKHPAEFISRILSLPVPKLPGVAKVVINHKTKTIVFAGDVELSATTVSQAGLTISVGTAGSPNGTTAMPTPADSPRSGTAKLKDLVDAFNTLKVSPEDRITIVKQLYESGALHCQLEED